MMMMMMMMMTMMIKYTPRGVDMKPISSSSSSGTTTTTTMMMMMQPQQSYADHASNRVTINAPLQEFNSSGGSNASDSSYVDADKALSSSYACSDNDISFSSMEGVRESSKSN